MLYTEATGDRSSGKTAALPMDHIVKSNGRVSWNEVIHAAAAVDAHNHADLKVAVVEVRRYL